jgi:hypothetical protein
MACAWCKENAKFVKAHSIPEAFFRVMREEEDSPILVSNVAKHWPAKAPIGVYDREMLCENCEPRFSKVDDYGTEVLIRRLDESFVAHTGGPEVAYVGRDIDQERLKLFFLSVLWRAANSKQPFYGRVTLGPHRDRVREVLDRGTSPNPDEYSVVMSRWVVSPGNEAMTGGLLSPFLEKWDGIHAVRFYFGKVVAYMKVDQRPFPTNVRKFALGRQPNALQFPRQLETSKDFSVMVKVATAARRDRA